MSAVPVGARCQQTLGWREVAVKLARSAVLRNPTFVPSAVGELRGDNGAEAERQLSPPANWCCRPKGDVHSADLAAWKPSLPRQRQNCKDDRTQSALIRVFRSTQVDALNESEFGDQKQQDKLREEGEVKHRRCARIILRLCPAP